MRLNFQLTEKSAASAEVMLNVEIVHAYARALYQLRNF